MRIHRIEIEGFGPFRERQTVDIDEVAADGLFLIAGPTGAGKSSILDAVSFALYDAVPRYEGDISRVRSDHSDPAEPSEVRLEFSMGGERYRVTRSPKYLRPAKRGGGTTEQAATASLEHRVGESWVGIAARPVDVAAELAPVLVLTKDQFQQVILLAQNRFQRFLHAKDQERQGLLRTLFRTERFEGIEQAFAERRRALAGEHDRLLADGAARRERFDAALAAGVALTEDSAPASEPVPVPVSRNVSDDANPQDPEPSEPPLADPDTQDDAAIAVIRSAAQTALALAEAAEAVERSAEGDVIAAEAESHARLRRDRATEEARQLASIAPEIAGLTAALAAAEQAESVRPAKERSARAEEHRAAAEHELATAASELAGATLASAGPDAAGAETDASQDPVDGPPPLVTPSRDELDTAEAATQAALDALAVAVAAEAGLPGHRRTASQFTEQADALDAELAAARAERDALPATIQTIRDTLAVSEREAAELDGALSAQRAAEQEQSARTETARARARLADAEARVAAAARESSRTAAEFSRLVAARLDGFAAELAEGLNAGDPCPVCGSRQHPAPAPLAGESVTQDRVDQADEERVRRERALTAERTAEQDLRIELAEATARSGSGTDAEVDARLAAAGEGLASARAAAGRLPAERAALERAEEALSVAAARIEQVLGSRDAARAGAAHAEARRAEDEALSGAARGDFPSAADRDAALRGLRGAIIRARDARVALDLADTEAHAARTALDEALAATPFGTLAEAGAARLDRASRDTAERRTAQHRADETRVREILAEPELVGLPALPSDLEAARAARESARERRALTAVRAEALDRAAREAGALSEDFRTAREAAGERGEALGRLRQLADAVEGKDPNTRRMRLETFVLAARLEAIIAAANTRLTRMVHGRYLLQHDDELQYRGRQSGLGIRVLDEHTGRARSTDSLSGGETFLASLALALGLADVVTAEAGGVTLDTLFIDEGFGSLDPEALAEAMATLDSLREGGRAVALISHVSEMREQVPAQIEVRVQPDGTSRILRPGRAASHPNPGAETVA